MSGVFISYREDDAKPWALLLRDELVEFFGEQNVFLDKDALHAGSWREQLQVALDRCGVAIVVIGRHWLDARGRDGARRLADPNDVHRQEIAALLARGDVTVIPVLVDGSAMPRPEDLSSDIRSLADQQARSLADRSAHRELDLKALVEDIERATGMVARASSPTRPRQVSWWTWATGAVLIALSLWVGSRIGDRHWTGAVLLYGLPIAVAAALATLARKKSGKA